MTEQGNGARARRALITGTGQGGSFLAEFLLSRGYEVHSIVRRASTFNTERLDAIYADPHNQGVRLRLLYGDITVGAALPGYFARFWVAARTNLIVAES